MVRSRFFGNPYRKREHSRNRAYKPGVYKDSMVVIMRLRLGRTPCAAEVNHAWRCNTCLDVVGRRWCRAGVGDFPRMGDLVVMSRGFVGVYRGFAVSAVFSRRRFQGRFFTNRGFPTFPWGQYPRGRRIPVNSHAGYGRTGANREIPTVLPHHPHTTAPIPVSPASTDTDGDPASANASNDADGYPSINKRLCRH